MIQKKASKKRAKSSSGGKKRKDDIQLFEQDYLSRAFGGLDMVPEKYRGTDRYLDVVSWNIRYFNDRDPKRVDLTTKLLEALNADIIVLQEIMNESLEAVIKELEKRKAGYYEVTYGTTGGNQRVAILHDIEWVRTKDLVVELFEKGEHRDSTGKDVFPRLPLQASFTTLDHSPFDFQIVGVHLKSQRGGGEEQRELAAEKLRKWLVTDAQRIDADVVIVGDWNASPESPVWKPFHDLESKGDLLFRTINDDSDFSHLMYRNKNDFGTRLDLAAVTTTSAEWMNGNPEVVKWKPLAEVMTATDKFSSTTIKTFLGRLKEEVSDHLPLVSRFYFTKDEAD